MKHHSRSISRILILAYAVLLQAAAWPLRAERAPAPTENSLSVPEQGPGVVEQEGGSAGPARKRSIVPILIGVAAAGAIAAFVALVVLKTKYDLAGSWDFNFTSTAPAHTWTWTLVFKGDKKSGTFTDAGDTGKYTLNAKDVEITYDDWDIVLSGRFDAKDKMSGSGTFAGMTIGNKEITSATWTATRLSSTGSLRPGNVAASPFDNRKQKK
jgi:hypothetical protein